MSKFKIVLLFLVGIICSSLNQSNFNNDISRANFNILFVGNSLTYTNDLPELVKKVAKQKGMNIQSKMMTFPNYAIMDHWNDGDIQKEIADNGYDFVIIQQGPSSQPYGRKTLIEYGGKLAKLCKNHDVELGYFMVWPSLSYYHTFEGVIRSYRDASAINNAILFPVGEVWKEHFDSTENFDYYSSDGFHPSLKGSQVAAEIIVAYLFKIQLGSEKKLLTTPSKRH